MRLFLISQTENDLTKEVLAEPIKICTDSRILFELYDPANEFDTLVITKSYVDSIGYSIVCSALRSYLKPYKILYVMNEDIFDVFVNEMSYAHITPVKADVRKLKPKTINQAIEHDGKVDTTNIEINVLGQFRNLVRGYFEVNDVSAREIYINQHRDEIMTALSSLLGLANETELLSVRLKRMESMSFSERALIEGYQRSILKIFERHRRARDKITNLENVIIDIMDDIEHYKSYHSRTNVMHSQNNNIILYFKELEDIEFFRFYDCIFKYLQIKGIYVKSLVVCDKSYLNYESLGYRRCTDTVTLAYLSENDKLVRMGPVNSLLSLLTSEQFRTEVLMIYDKGRELTSFIESPNMTTMYIGKYREGYTNISVPDSSFISPYEGGWTNVRDLLKSPYDISISALSYDTFVYRHSLTNMLTDIVTEQIQSAIL